MRRLLLPVLAVLGCVTATAHADDDDEVLRLANEASSARKFDKAIELADKFIASQPKNYKGHYVRGIACFKAGKIDESIKSFEQTAELKKDFRKELWQLGIAYYYAGRFQDGVDLFALHKTFNPDDVENAAWHFLCMARAKDIETARKNLIPIKGDTRVPMAEVQRLFAGELKPDDVIAAAKAGEPTPAKLNKNLFYAHLYIGLYYEAAGDAAKAKEHLVKAFRDHEVGDYMWDVARIHVDRLNAKKE